MTNQTTKTADQAAYSVNVPNTPLRFLGYVCRNLKGYAFWAVLGVVVAQVAEFAAIYAISNLVDQFNAGISKDMQMQTIVFWGSIFLALGILDRVGWRASGFLGIALAIKADAVAFKELYSYVMKHSHSYFLDRFAGAISNKISNAAGNIADLIFRIMWDIIPVVMSIFVTLWMFSSISWIMGLVFFLVLSCVFFVNLQWVKSRRPLVVAYAAVSSKFRGAGVDLLSNIQTTRQYTNRAEELNHLSDIINDKVTKDFKQAYKGEWLMVVNGFFGVFLMSAILFVVYVMLKNDAATAGQLVLVLLLLARVGHSFNIMGQIMNSFVRRYGEIQDGLEEVLIPYEIVDKEDAKDLKVKDGNIDWNNVTFEYGPNRVFDNFNLSIPAGQRVGLVGPSGAGKTTFVSLMLRQHDIQGGEILIDGQNISEITQDSLRSSIAVVPQEPLLFHRSIRENIAYGKPEATEEEIKEVAKKAQAHDFIMELPEGYETMVGERGVKLSGGQKQRVAIARAMLKDAPILVLDEATSALDSESEVAIQTALQKLMEGKTVVAIAHRLSTLREMDRLIVMEDGKIVEDGTHSELTKSSGTYSRLWDHQAGGFLPE